MKILPLVLLSTLTAVSAYNPNIKKEHYGLCKRRVEPIEEFAEKNDISFMDISNLTYNEARSHEILRTKFYFRGKTHFSVGVSQFKDPTIKPFHQTLIAYTYRATKAAIFTERAITTANTPFCDKLRYISKLFSSKGFEELSLIVTKGEFFFVTNLKHDKAVHCRWNNELVHSQSEGSFFEVY